MGAVEAGGAQFFSPPGRHIHTGKGCAAMKRLTLTLLAAAVLLTGCGTGTEEDSPAAGLPADEEVLLYINDREIPAWRYFCWLERACTEAEENLSLERCAALKAQALADTALYAAVEDLAAEHGVTLTAEETAALNPDPWTALPPARQTELTAVGGLYAKLCTLAQQEGSTLAPGGEALAAFAQEQGFITLDRILIPAGEGAADKAAEIYARLNGGAQAAFEAEKAHSADTAGIRTFRMGDGTVSLALESAAAVLEAGQLSGILETEEGFSILLRYPTDLTNLAVPWLDARLRSAAEGAQVQTTQQYEALDVNGFRKSLLREANENKGALSSS